MGWQEFDKPIFSNRAGDLAFRDSIDAFVVLLAERVDELQDAEAAADCEGLSGLACKLSTDAQYAGFEAVTLCLEELSRACHQDPRGDLREYLVNLTHLAQRIRLGHRGAI